MNNIDFQNGLHLSVEAMKFLQEAYTAPLKALAMDSNKDSYILWGMNVTTEGSSVYISEGALAYKGEILPFAKTLLTNGIDVNIYLLQKVTQVVYKDGNAKDALFDRYANVGEDTDNATTVELIGKYLDLRQRRLHHKILASAGTKSVTVESGYKGGVDTDDIAIAIGIPTKELSVPGCQLDGYGHMFLHGEIHSATGGTLTSPIATITDLELDRPVYAKAIYYITHTVTTESGTTTEVLPVYGLVYILADGTITTKYDDGKVYRVVFDNSEIGI